MVLRVTLPLLHDGSLPPVALLIQWLAHFNDPASTTITIEHLPPSNGSLPDLFSSAGIQLVSIVHPPIATPFRWEGYAGSAVLVNGTDPQAAMPVHHGELPHALPLHVENNARYEVIDVARYIDAYAVHGAQFDNQNMEQGAPWRPILQALTGDKTDLDLKKPYVSSDNAHTGVNKFYAWNALPFARHALVSFKTNSNETAPQGLRNSHGARFPVQIVENNDGHTCISAMPLEALACHDYEAIAEAVPGCHWEVSSTVIDNGKVRAELDALGHIIRLCTDGRFVELTGPALQPLCDGVPLTETAHITVLETGPIRARVSISRQSARGQLDLIYSLHAHDDVLRVSATWNGIDKIVLNFPTPHNSAPITVAGELAQWHLPQHADICNSAQVLVQGIRWARLQNNDQTGLAVIGGRPLTMSAQNGHIGIHLKQNVSFALCENKRPKHTLDLGSLSQSLDIPHCAENTTAQAPAFRLVCEDACVCWLRRPDGWSGELILWQQSHISSRCTLYFEKAQDVQRCDVRGNSIDKLRKLPDCDGYECDIASGDFALIRWR